jgi:CelD/BcsL family acetyltransferase involved in cellulose biosynthesis
MDIAVGYRPARDEGAPAATRRADRVARLEIFRDLPTAEPFWRRLEAERALATPYQRFDLLAAWQRHVGERAGVTPFIVTGFDPSGAPIFLWPFGETRTGPLRIVRFLGSKHANFNLGLWRRESLATIASDELHALLARVTEHGIDVVALLNQPLHWDGLANPFSLLPHQASVDMSERASLVPAATDGTGGALSASMRARLRNKERKLKALAGYRYVQAASGDEIDRLLDSFFALKSAHMAAQGLANVFAEPGVPEFLRAACHATLPSGRPLIEIHALEGGGEVLALFGTTVDDHRFSSMFNTYTLGDSARYSPGLVLLMHMVTDCAKRGLPTFDIGVGRAHYKSFFCRETEPLFDTFLPLTSRGRIAAAALSAAFAAKRTIKQSRTMWSAVQALRRVRAR